MRPHHSLDSAHRFIAFIAVVAYGVAQIIRADSAADCCWSQGEQMTGPGPPPPRERHQAEVTALPKSRQSAQWREGRSRGP
jgi:hypothetical protein